VITIIKKIKNKKDNNNNYYLFIKLYDHPHAPLSACYLSKKVSGKSVDKSGHGYQ
jgi:hypothetical protein